MKSIKYLTIFVALLFLSNSLYAQIKISGTVIDSTSNVALKNVSVLVAEKNIGTLTDSNGFFELKGLHPSQYTLQFKYIGYETKVVKVDLSNQNINLNIKLKPVIIETQEIVVTGGYTTTQHDNAVKIDVMQRSELQSTGAANILSALAKKPGIDLISIGNGIAKPVVRGLSRNNVLALYNGMRFEDYQFSEDHGLGIDEFGIERIEIIKGPASLLYGSDAVGGVVNFISESPAPIGKIQGDVNIGYLSNANSGDGSIGLKGSSQNIFGGFRFGYGNSEDYLQGGGDFAPNSRFNKLSTNAFFGFLTNSSILKLNYNYSKQNLGMIVEEAMDLISTRDRKIDIWYNDLENHFLSFENTFYINNFHIDLNFSYQNNLRKEIQLDNIPNVEMRLQTLNYNARLYIPPINSFEIIFGIQGMYQNNTNENNRESKFLPNFDNNNIGIIGLMQYQFSNTLKFQTGLRFDQNYLRSRSLGNPDSSDYRPALSKDYANFNASLGMVYNITPIINSRINIATAYRVPSISELTSNGFHEDRYEIGNPNLSPQQSYEIDASVHLHSNTIIIDLAGFYNNINDYIYLDKSTNTLPTGESIYNYSQSDSKIYGIEATFHYHPDFLRNLNFISSYAYIIGKQDNGEYLPFIPANKINAEVKYNFPNLWKLDNFSIGLASSAAFSNKNIAPENEGVPGYALFDVSIGCEVPIFGNITNINLIAKNIFDKKYYDYMSIIRELGIYNPGRNIVINISMPLSFN